MSDQETSGGVVLGVLPDSDFDDACQRLEWFPYRHVSYDEYAQQVERTRDRLVDGGLRPLLVWVFVDELVAWCEAEGRSIGDATVWFAYVQHLAASDPLRLDPFVGSVPEHLLRDRTLTAFQDLVGGPGPLLGAQVAVYGGKAEALLDEACERDGAYAVHVSAVVLDDATRHTAVALRGEVGFDVEEGERQFASGVQEEGLLGLLACACAAHGGAVLVYRRDQLLDEVEGQAFRVVSGQPQQVPFPPAEQR